MLKKNCLKLPQIGGSHDELGKGWVAQKTLQDLDFISREAINLQIKNIWWLPFNCENNGFRNRSDSFLFIKICPKYQFIKLPH